MQRRNGARLGLALMFLGGALCAALALGIYAGQNWASLFPPAATRTPAPAATASPIVGETFTPAVATVTPEVTGPAPTKTPKPTKSPRPTQPPEPTELSWPAPLAGLTASKLGLHALDYVDNGVKEFVKRIHPRVMKTVDEVGLMRDVKAAWPGTVTVGRLSGQNVNLDWILKVDAAAAAQEYVSGNLARYQANPAVDYWEGWNEFNPASPEEMAWFAQFEAARACLMQQNGVHAAVGTFGVGWPASFDSMQAFLPALEAAHRCGGIFTLHEYVAPTFECGVSVGVPGILPGAPAINVPAGPLSLRYRLWYEGLLKPRGLGDLPLVISELGIDGNVSLPGCHNPGGQGWREMENWWRDNGWGADAAMAYVKVLAWYDQQLRADSYVIGATIFTTGAPDSDSRWYPFDVHEVLLPLAIYEAQLQ